MSSALSSASSKLRSPANGTLTAPGMWPRTGSRFAPGSSDGSPANRSGARASTIASRGIAEPRVDLVGRHRVVAALVRLEDDRLDDGVATPVSRRPRHAVSPPSITATSSWPKCRSSHHSRAAPPVMPRRRRRPRTRRAPMPARPAAAANASAVGSGWRPRAGASRMSDRSVVQVEKRGTRDVAGLVAARSRGRGRRGRTGNRRTGSRTARRIGGPTRSRACRAIA